ncbi:6-phosphogluconolactonase [Aliikangiella sp. G2MR2-5]|uniref:6-phosphogluconolactonase n=1 Tax=Aliikangiella sp. G2MR2-5 TaxID=2788943 RepID=UPI0018AA401C|nr:6-phosphogluconolactonase [Aliikangiella sp. G2MR2-5]
MKEFHYKSRDELYKKVAERCAQGLTRGVEKRGRASFVVPGGSTPAPVFGLLSEMSLDWHNVFVAPSDERWVDTSHAQSNEGLINRTLLVNKASKARLMPLKNEAATPELGEIDSEKSISLLERPFDITLLGMGPDGHFASLFPGSAQLSDALNPSLEKPCIGIDATGCPVAGEYTERMSLTLSAILNSRLIILLITGDEKLSVMREAKENYAPELTPISALLNQSDTRLEIHWAG